MKYIFLFLFLTTLTYADIMPAKKASAISNISSNTVSEICLNELIRSVSIDVEASAELGWHSTTLFLKSDCNEKTHKVLLDKLIKLGYKIERVDNVVKISW